MKLFWFIRKYMVLIGLVAAAYISADQIAITSATISKQQLAKKQRFETEKEKMRSRIAAHHDFLKHTGAFDGRTTTAISQADQSR